jgi:SnoaL-like polyketide cyclase
MRRSVLLPVTCLLALATGVALLLAGAAVAVPDGAVGRSGPPREVAEADAALVRRFYDAVNATLETGDTASLAALLASDFVDRAAPPGDATTGGGLVQHVLALRATFPAMRLVPEDVQAHEDWVQARVRAEGVARSVFLGVRFSGELAAWPPLDGFRVAGGRIAERWAAGDRPAPPQPLARVPLAETPAGAVVRLARLTFAPGVREPEAGLLGPLLLADEAGTLAVRVLGPAALARGEAVGTGGPGATAVPRGETVSLHPGDGLVLPPGTHYVVENAGPTPAVVLALALLPAGTGALGGGTAGWPWAGSPDVAAQLLVDGTATDLPDGPATLALGRLTLAPGAELAADLPVVPRLVVVETGTLQLATTGVPPATLAVGQGAVIQRASGLALRNAGNSPLVVLLATITSPAPATGPDGGAGYGTAKAGSAPAAIS